ncbi:MAG: hypothetical protein PVH89_10200 [Gammaproteobacteria bacterium]
MSRRGRGGFLGFVGPARGTVGTALALLAVAPLATAAEADFIGSWLFYIDHSPTGYAYGTLEIERTGDGVAGYIDGGPAEIGVDGDEITLLFDWDNGGGIVSVSELTGSLDDDEIEGIVRLDGESTGTWRATPRAGPPGLGEPANPVDLGGTWQMRTTDGSGKVSFEMTPAAEAFQQAFMAQYDDPVLRCVSDGLVRVTGGPFAKEILHQEGRITILYEDMHEIRRVYLDAEFPEDVEFLDSPLGYSIGHWEGSTLVVETRGLHPALWHRAGGKPISAEAQITEYIYRGDDGNLHVELVLDDPVNYERSPLRHTVFAPAPNYEFSYYACDPDAFYRALYLEEQLEFYFGRSRYRR